MKRNVGFERVKFTTELTEIHNDVEVVFSAVGTPLGEDDFADLKYVLALIYIIAMNLRIKASFTSPHWKEITYIKQSKKATKLNSMSLASTFLNLVKCIQF